MCSKVVSKKMTLEWLDGFEKRRQDHRSVYQALFEQLKDAIEQGRLRAGDQLPTHRRLAKQLNIAIATVTRSYHLAEQHGLVYARVGKGSYVSAYPNLPNAIRAKEFKSINLSIIKPQVSIGEAELTEQLQSLSAQDQLTNLMDYQPEAGSLSDLHTARGWLSSNGVNTDNRAISICCGAQHGLMVLINSLTRYGDHIAVEQYCYPGTISLATQSGRVLVAIEMDDEGIVPESLEQACRQYDLKMLVVVASHQNPTATVMSVQRRREIANIVSLNSVHLIDDDVYGFLSPELPPISSFAIENSFYLSSLSKSVFPGLRVGYITAPLNFKQRIDAEIRSSVWMPAPLTLALASRLIESGQAKVIQKAQKQLAKKRQRLCAKLLQGCEYVSQLNGYHIWLLLPAPWTSEAFSEKLEQQGVRVSAAGYFNATADTSVPAVRISLMSPASEEELSFGLNIVKQQFQKDMS